MRGIGASSRLWNLIDRQPSIPLTGTMFDCLHTIAFNDLFPSCSIKWAVGGHAIFLPAIAIKSGQCSTVSL